MKPAFSRISPVNINGVGTNRLMIVLTTRGCEYARKSDGGCTVCGFLNHAKEDITEEEIVKQLDYSLETNNLKDVKEIDLLTLGSFLNDREVSEDTRRILLKRIARLTDIERVSFESRAEYVTLEKLGNCKEILGDKIVEMGIGLESADDHVRNKIIKKGLSKKSFENIVRMLKQMKYNLLVYLLIKPPHLSEKQSIEDAVKSAEYVFEIAKRYDINARVAFEPVFICENTPLEKLFENLEYRLVNLWSVVEIIKKIHRLGNVFIGLSDENLSLDRRPNSCHLCNEKIIREIERFNRTQDAAPLNEIDCVCKKKYIAELEKEVI